MTEIFKKLFFVFLLLLSPYVLASSDLFKNAAGHYEGTLTSNDKGEYSNLSVKADLSSDKGDPKTLTISSEQGVSLLVFEFSKINKKDFVIGGPFVDAAVKLKKDEGDDCFTEPSNHIDFCFFRDGITAEVTNLTKQSEYALSLNRFKNPKPIPQEIPQVFDLKTAIDRAWNYNFDNRIEFEHVMQAKYGALAAKRNLTPHVSFSTIVNNVKPTILSIIGAAGDLLPFLFPTRWLQAKRAGLLSQAEQDAMTLMRLDTATQIEAQFYGLEDYRKLVDHYSYALKRAKRLLEIMQIKVRAGLVKPVAGQDFFTRVGEMQDDSQWMTSQFEDQKISVAQVLGFYNKDAVKDAIIGNEALPISKAKPLDSVELKKMALDHPIEIKQLELLRDATINNKKQVAWNWLDPTGDPTLGLGWALKSSINVADSMVREANLRIEDKRHQLEHQVETAVSDYNAALSAYPNAFQLEQTQIQRLDEYEQVLKGSGKEDTDRAIGLLQDYINEEIRLQFDLLAFRVARARIDRLLLQGFYSKAPLPPKINRDLKN